MDPLTGWMLVAAAVGVSHLLVYALMRAASRASRNEELLVHRKHSRVHQLDPTLVALHAYRGRFEGGGDEATGEGPPWPKDAA